MRGESCIIFYCSSSKDAAGIPALLMTIRINNVKKSTKGTSRSITIKRKHSIHGQRRQCLCIAYNKILEFISTLDCED